MATVLAASPGERLRTLRGLLGLTQAELATTSGVAQSWISQVETSAREATSDGLEAVARATQTPLNFFDVRPTTIPLSSLRFRKLSTASKITTRRVLAFFAESYRITESILSTANYPTPHLPYAANQGLGQPEIEAFAVDTRECLGLAPDSPVPNLTRACERVGIAIAPIVLPHDEEMTDAGTGHYGTSYWGGIGAAALIGYFPGGEGDRQRFTLAHEIGHLVLHSFRPRAVGPEDEANAFAGALLLPQRRAQELISDRTSLTEYARLKATWGISVQALIMRASQLGLISDTRKRSIFVQLSAKGWRKKEPVSVGSETPRLLWTLLTQRFGERPYLSAAEELAIHPAVLRSIAPSPTAVTGSHALATVHSLVRI